MNHTPAIALRVLRYLLDGKSVPVAGTLANVTLDQAQVIARDYGYPDMEAMEDAVARLAPAVAAAESRPKPKGSPFAQRREETRKPWPSSRPERVLPDDRAASIAAGAVKAMTTLRDEEPEPEPRGVDATAKAMSETIRARRGREEPEPEPDQGTGGVNVDSYADVDDLNLRRLLASDNPAIRASAEAAVAAMRTLRAEVDREAVVAAAEATVTRCRNDLDKATKALAAAEEALAMLAPGKRRRKGSKRLARAQAPATESCPRSDCDVNGLRGRQGKSMHMWRVHGQTLRDFEAQLAG